MVWRIEHAAGRAVATLVTGAAGAGVAWVLAVPVPMLLGSAVAVSLAGLAGARVHVATPIRTACFIFLGIAVGAGFDADAAAAMRRWPLAFLTMGIGIAATLFLCRWTLVQYFNFDRRSALLAAAPGHLSFVVAIAADTASDVARITVTQSVRLLLLTLVVPFVAVALGYDLHGVLAGDRPAMGPVTLGVLAAVGILAGLAFARISVPAPMLMGAMVTSAIGHVSGLVDGTIPTLLILPAYLVLGCLIGTRFNGITLSELSAGLGAGLAVTLIASASALLMSGLMALAIGMPLPHLMVAFAPGGLETMIAIGAAMGVVPGFVAACHMARLMALSVLLPVALGRDAAQVRDGVR